jgi:hypothetical protein
VTAPAAWRHAVPTGEFCGAFVSWGAGRCGCTTPEPDTASPCGFEGCELDEWLNDPHECWCMFEEAADAHPGHHPHQPTLCLRCHHPIERAP